MTCAICKKPIRWWHWWVRYNPGAKDFIVVRHAVCDKRAKMVQHALKVVSGGKS